MMLYPAINKLNELTDSRYTLVVLAAKRARDIIDGKPVLTEVQAERPVSLATNEIAEGKITYKRVDASQIEVAESAQASISEEYYELSQDAGETSEESEEQVEPETHIAAEQEL